MPVYTYLDQDGHERQVVHRMLYTTGITCTCGLEMWRKPTVPAINWNGLKPSGGEYHPVFQDLFDENNLARRRAEFEVIHEEHETRTANES